MFKKRKPLSAKRKMGRTGLPKPTKSGNIEEATRMTVGQRERLRQRQRELNKQKTNFKKGGRA